MPRYRRIWLLLCLAAPPIAAQQPFYTDDADVTPARRVHLELSNQYSFLQTSAFPNQRQNALVYQLNYGIRDGLEVSVDSPLVAIINARNTVSPRIPFGAGDTNVAMKWNFRRETDGSRWPALTVAYAVELPTGDTDTQLGSGLTDHRLIAIAQKTLTSATKLRINQGVLFSGNTLTGAVGLRARGTVYINGASLIRQFTPRFAAGIEANGAWAVSGSDAKAALQQQAAGKLQVRDNLSIDFGVAVGQFGESPRVSLQLGLSLDF